ncbi:MAG: HAD family hydrolase [Prolixibacteraceae bacterium]|jgi:HAD superfamily hydrolase (TIGR01484 family)|nr:HAD family hydrolase [Prolixibacteraceae bacterium]
MQTNGKIKLVATDLDGTFLKNDKTVSPKNMESLHAMGRKGIVRVAATGRNLQKTKEVISPDVPFDYIVFSSGAGIYDWRNGKLLYSRNIPGQTVGRLSEYLICNRQSFHLFRKVPDNHHCWYFRSESAGPEFERYFAFHNSFAEPFPEHSEINSEACQFLIIIPCEIGLFEQMKEEMCRAFPGLNIVRTSSPLHTPYIWIEIFHESVSKGNGVKFICEKEGIDPSGTMGIGNDYNDLDLLEFTRFSYLVENGPNDLKHRFLPAKSNEEDAFSFSVAYHL